MPPDLTAQFASLRRALKVVSYGLLVYAVIRVPWTAVTIMHTEQVFSDMAGAGR